MIRKHPLSVILVMALMLSALTACLLTARWFFAANESSRLQAQAEMLTRRSTLMQQLATEAIDYSHRNPALNPVLYELNLKSPPGGNGSTPSVPTTSQPR